MDAIAALTSTSIPEIYGPTIAAFLPLLEARRADIESVKRTTFKYGTTERHQLDVYYPPDPILVKNGKTPVLFFVYGGGFTQGERVLPFSNDLVYTNVGSFFAKQGFLTIIPDYRLVPHVKFPEPVEDIRDAFTWIVSNVKDVASGSSVYPDLDAVFWMGHSAGVSHVSTLLLDPGLLPDDLRSRVRGLILKGGGYKYVPSQGLDEILLPYFGTWDVAAKASPISLLSNAPENILKNFPDVLLMVSEREFDGAWEGNEAFAGALKDKFGKEYRVVTMKGHNHVSPQWALCTGQGEEWALEVTEWIKAKL